MTDGPVPQNAMPCEYEDRLLLMLVCWTTDSNSPGRERSYTFHRIHLRAWPTQIPPTYKIKFLPKSHALKIWFSTLPIGA